MEIFEAIKSLVVDYPFGWLYVVFSWILPPLTAWLSEDWRAWYTDLLYKLSVGNFFFMLFVALMRGFMN